MEEAREREPQREREEEEVEEEEAWGKRRKTGGWCGEPRRGVIYIVTVTFPATSPTDSSLEGLEQCFLARFGYKLNMNLKFRTLFLKFLATYLNSV
jgi:hypothetical protein